MYERFTREAREVVNRAEKEARYLNHGYIGSEHLLLGVIGEDTGIVSGVLRGLGVSADSVRLEVLKLVKKGLREVPSGRLKETMRVRQTIGHAVEEACRLGDNYVAPEHLLLGFMCDDGGVAKQALLNLNLNLEQLRDYVLKTRQQND